MMFDFMLKHELERVETMSVIDVVAYVNRLMMRLEHYDCTDEERKNGLELLWRLTERVRFLKVNLEATSSRFSPGH